MLFLFTNMAGEWKSNVLGLISIVVSILAFVNKEDRLFVAVVLIGAIVFYIIDSFSDDVDKHEERIKKLEERIKIHDQLVNIKGDVEYLKKEVSKK